MWALVIILFVATLAILNPGAIQSFGGILGGNLSASQIAQYAANAGFSGDDLATAVAIALAESSGNPTANGDTALTPGGSVGLWQINIAAHPEFEGWNLTDPQTNADAAYAVYQAAGYNFRPWSTYKSGAFAQYLSDAQGAVNA